MNLLTLVFCLLSTLSFVQDNRSDLDRIRALRARAEATRDYAAALQELKTMGGANYQALNKEAQAELALTIAEVYGAQGDRNSAIQVLENIDFSAWPALQARVQAVRNPSGSSLAETVRELESRGDYESLRGLGASAAPALETIVASRLDTHPNWNTFGLLAQMDGARAVNIALQALPRMRLMLRLQLINQIQNARLRNEVMEPLLVALLADPDTAHSTLQSLLNPPALQLESVRKAFLKIVDADPKMGANWLRLRAASGNLDMGPTWEALAQHPLPELRTLAERNLLQITINTNGSIEPFGRLVDSPDEEVRKELSRAVLNREPTPKIQDMARRLAQDPSPTIRRNLLQNANHRIITPDLLQIYLKDSDPDLVTRALNFAAQRGFRSVLNAASPNQILVSIQWSDFRNEGRQLVDYCLETDLARRKELAGAFLRFAQNTQLDAHQRMRAVNIALRGQDPAALELAVQLMQDPKSFAFRSEMLSEISAEDRVKLVERGAANPAVSTELIAWMIESSQSVDPMSERCRDLCIQRFIAFEVTDNAVLTALERVIRGIPAGPQAMEYTRQLMARSTTAHIGLRFIGSTRMPEQFPLLAAWVMNPANEGGPHSSAIEALLRYGSPEAANVMLERLTGAPSKLREPYQKALQQLTEFFEQRSAWQERLAKGNTRANAVQELIKLCEDKEPNVRAAAVRSLARLDAVDELPRVVRMLKDESPLVRSAAEESLALLQKPR